LIHDILTSVRLISRQGKEKVRKIWQYPGKNWQIGRFHMFFHYLIISFGETGNSPTTIFLITFHLQWSIPIYGKITPDEH